MRSVHMFEELSDDGTVVGSFTKSVAAMKIYDDDRYIDIDYDAGAFKNDALTSNVYKNSFKISPVAYDGGDAASRVETTSRAVTVLPAVAMSAFPAVLPSGVGVPSSESHDAVDGVDLNSTALLYASSTSNRTLSGGGTASSFGSTLLASTAGPRAVDEDINSFYFYETEQFTVLWILFFMIVLGNTAVLITLVLNKNRKSRMNFFIKQLAAADLAVGLINVLTDIVWRITITWHAGNAACKLIRFLQAVVTFASTYVLVALSIDRYDAITHPMNFSGSWKRARLLVIAAWMLSTLFSIPMIFLFKETIVEGQTQCWIALQTWQWQVYMTLIAVVLFLVPAVIISACYTVIVRTIWSKSKLLLVPPTAGVHHHGRPHGEDHRNLRHHNNDDLHDCRRASSRGIIPKAKIKTVKMTFVIVFVFVICWSPYIVFDLLQVYGFIPRTQTNIAIATLIQSLAPLNSAANPVIYCLFSTHMCRTLRKLPPFKWLTCCLNLCIPGLETPGTTSNGSMGGVGAAGGGSGSNGSGTGRRLIGGGRVRFGTRSGDSTRTTTLTTTTSTSRRSGGSGSVSSLRQHTVRIAQPPVQLGNKHGVAGLGGAVTYGVRQQHRVAVSVV